MPDRLTSGGIIFGTLVQPLGSAGTDSVATASPAVTTLPRVLFVDDDPSIRQLVELALEELAIELVICASAAEARKALRQAPVKLLITDLMMPGESGFDLLQQLHDDPALRAGALQVVFSAGLMNADNRARLVHLDIWRELPKPISVLDLERCVVEALACPLRPDGDTPATTPMPLTANTPRPESAGDTHALAISQNFGGDEVLYRAFLDVCVEQFPSDMATAEQAFAQRDATTLRRVAHNLKSVLFTLGREAAAEQARALESAASTVNWPQAESCWPGIRQTLSDMMKPTPGRP